MCGIKLELISYAHLGPQATPKATINLFFFLILPNSLHLLNSEGRLGLSNIKKIMIKGSGKV